MMTSGTATATASNEWDSSSQITYEEMNQLSALAKQAQREARVPDIVVLDVREANDFADAHIPGAFNLPISVFEEALSLDPDVFARRHAFPKPLPSDCIALYCRSGRRSTIALNVAHAAGYSRVRNYVGSWNDWVAKKDSERQQPPQQQEEQPPSTEQK